MTATSSSAGPVFGLPSGRKPPKGSEWLVAEVVVDSGAKDSVELESLRFTTTSRARPEPRKPGEILIATDQTRGLDPSGALRPGGKVAMSLAFPIPKGDEQVLMTFRVDGKTGTTRFLLR